MGVLKKLYIQIKSSLYFSTAMYESTGADSSSSGGLKGSETEIRMDCITAVLIYTEGH